jgi:hypothetical protein
LKPQFACGMPESPRNLRYSDSDRDCAGCTGFKPQSQTCAMYSDWPVTPELVCDSWNALDPEAVRDNGG